MKKPLREYTALESAFLENLAGPARGNIKKAMELAGYSVNTPQTQMIKQLKHEIIEIAQELLAAGSIKAAFAIDDVLDSPNSLGAKNKIAAAKELLDRAGIVKPSGDAVNLNVPEGGIIILPAKNSSRVVESDGVDA